MQKTREDEWEGESSHSSCECERGKGSKSKKDERIQESKNPKKRKTESKKMKESTFLLSPQVEERSPHLCFFPVSLLLKGCTSQLLCQQEVCKRCIILSLLLTCLHSRLKSLNLKWKELKKTEIRLTGTDKSCSRECSTISKVSKLFSWKLFVTVIHYACISSRPPHQLHHLRQWLNLVPVTI